MTLDELRLEITVHTEEALRGLEKLAEALKELGAKTPDIQPKLDTAALEQAAQRAKERLNALREAIAQAAKSADDRSLWKTLRQGLHDAAEAGADTEAELTRLARQCRDGGAAFDELRSHSGAAGTGFGALQGQTAAAGAAIGATLAGLVSDCRELAAAAQISGTISVNAAPALTAIAGVQAAIGAVVAYAAQSGMSLTGGQKPSGGGGGGSSGSRGSSSSASEVPGWRRELDAALAALAHRKAMDAISPEEEISALEKLYQQYKRHAEARIELEEKVYAAQKALRQQNVEQLDDLTDAVISALEERGEAERRAQQTLLDEERRRWEDWRDAGVSAVEEQIAALDELAEAEDRAADDEAEQRKLASLREQIAYEQDDYNRAMLERQLAQAVADREERLRKLALADQKAALEAQMDAIEEQAQAKLDALDEQEDALEKAYDQRLEQAALRAEAERLLMADSQQELLALLGEYAADYDALGRSFGERLLEGFAGAVGSVNDWFAAFAAQLEATRADLSALAAQSTASASETAPRGVSVNQTNVFNQPVETPGETARRVRQANEALAEELLAGR